jgi:hypothetical protein
MHSIATLCCYNVADGRDEKDARYLEVGEMVVGGEEREDGAD